MADQPAGMGIDFHARDPTPTWPPFVKTAAPGAAQAFIGSLPHVQAAFHRAFDMATSVPTGRKF
jgi:hypothetical protein